MTMTMTEPSSVGTADRKRPVLVVEGLSKRYGAIKALSDVSFELYPGEVVGVLGDNGAGKSTLVNILAGAIPATHGRIVFEGTQADIQSPRDAHLLGIEAVYQDLALAKDLSVWQNIFLGNEQIEHRMATADRVAGQKGDGSRVDYGRGEHRNQAGVSTGAVWSTLGRPAPDHRYHGRVHMGEAGLTLGRTDFRARPTRATASERPYPGSRGRAAWPYFWSVRT